MINHVLNRLHCTVELLLAGKQYKTSGAPLKPTVPSIISAEVTIKNKEICSLLQMASYVTVMTLMDHAEQVMRVSSNIFLTDLTDVG